MGLELIHGRAGTLFPDPETGREAHALRDEQVRFFQEHGFVEGGSVLSADQIDALRGGLEAIRTGRNPRTDELYEVDEDYRRAPEENLFHFLGAWRIDTAFHDLLWHPAITVKAAQLLGVPRVRFWHDQVFYKPPRHPGAVTWHQDYSAHQQIGMKIRGPFLSVEDPDVFFFTRGRRGRGRSRVLAVGREAHGGRPQASSLSTRKP